MKKRKNIRTILKEKRDKFLNFLQEKGECYVINKNSNFSKLRLLISYVSAHLEESCSIAVTGCYRDYAAIVPGSKRLLVTRKLIDGFCESTDCNLSELVENRYIYLTTYKSYMDNKRRVREERKARKGKLGWVGETRSILKKKSTFYERVVLKALRKSDIKNIYVQYYIRVGRHQYFLDIFLPEKNLAIEVDGGYHKTESQIAYDRERDELLLSKGIKTFRIKNEDVLDEVKLTEFITKIKNQ